jgi:hypothetical protein
VFQSAGNSVSRPHAWLDAALSLFSRLLQIAPANRVVAAGFPGDQPALRVGMLIVLCGGLAAPSLAIDMTWRGDVDNNWHDANNWVGVTSSFPPTVVRRVPRDGDTATINVDTGGIFLAGDTNPINGLTISNGASLTTGVFGLAYRLWVDNGGSAVTSLNGASIQVIRTTCSPFACAPSGITFDTDNLTITGGGSLSMSNGHARVDGLAELDATAHVGGGGLIELGTPSSTGVVLRNSGTIRAGPGGGTLTIQRLGGGTFDLDGATAAARIGGNTTSRSFAVVTSRFGFPRT